MKGLFPVFLMRHRWRLKLMVITLLASTSLLVQRNVHKLRERKLQGPRELQVETRGKQTPQPDKYVQSLTNISTFDTNFGGCDINWNYNILSEKFQHAKHFTEVNTTVTEFYRNSLLRGVLQVHNKPDFNHRGNSRKGIIVSMRNLYLTGRLLMVFDCSLTYYQGGCQTETPTFNIDLLENAERNYVDSAVLIAQNYGTSYYHWLIENFCRLALLYDYLILNTEVRIIAYGIMYSTKGNVLFDLIGIDSTRIVQYNHSLVYFVSKLLIPTSTPCGGCIKPALRTMQTILRWSMAAKFPELNAESEMFQIVVQDRGYQHVRSFTNIESLLTNLTRTFLGVNIVVHQHTDDIITTAKKLYNANVIIGPHGANLANLIFASNHTTVMEVQPQNSTNGYRAVAFDVGARYVGFQSSTGSYYGKSLFYAPIDEIVEQVKKVVSSYNKKKA